MANTNILIKRSSGTSAPTSLNAGELAYSYLSNTVFIGTVGGNGAIKIGGQYYTNILDSATSQNTASTLVLRDTNGAFYGRLYGNSNAASTLLTSRNFSISGGDITASAQSFDGSADVTLSASLNSVPGLSAGYYGSSTIVPVIQVAANGRIMSVANAISSTSTSFNISDGTTSTVFESGNTFFQIGTKGITTAVSQNTVTISTDNTVLRSNTSTVGPQVINTNLSISGNVSITGNLNVLGNTTTINTVDYIVSDPMIYLAGNNYSSDIVNIGFAANYYDGSVERHTGLYRASDNKQYYLFDNYIPELSGNNQIDRANTSFRIATITANLTSANITSSQISGTTITGGSISGLSSDVSVSDGGTGVSSFTVGQVIIGNGTSGLQQLANVSSINTSISSNNTVNNLTTDVYGRVTNYTTQAIGGLTVAQGGTGQSTFNSGQIVIGSGVNGLQQLANVSSINTTLLANNTVDNIQVDVWGRVTSFTTKEISGLTVPQGGTGFASATTNGIIYGNASGALQVTAAAGTADQTWSNQILTTSNSGVPVWTTSLDGGSF